MEINEYPHHYPEEEFIRTNLAPHPIDQFQLWFHQAEAAEIPEVNAMILATASKEGRPSCRTVLLKQYDKEGLIFFTNYESRKAKEILENPYGMATFFWADLLRQVHIEGKIEKTSREFSAEYFSSRPRGSQLGAWASRQGTIIPNRETLSKNFDEARKKYENLEVPLPPYWGGFRLIPNRFEFWQGKENRLHDRFQYILEKTNWKIERLSP